MVGQRIFAAVAKIAVVENVSAGSADGNFRPADRIQMHVTTAGKHLDVAAADVLKSHGTIDGHDAKMRIAQVPRFHRRRIAAQSNVRAHAVEMNRSAGIAYRDVDG